ncbi:hypothetical protein GCM10009077_24690 [Roseibium denhamense]
MIFGDHGQGAETDRNETHLMPEITNGIRDKMDPRFPSRSVVVAANENDVKGHW